MKVAIEADASHALEQIERVSKALDELRLDVKRVRLAPGDVLVARLPGDVELSDKEVDQIKADVGSVFPGHKVIVLIGIELEVASSNGG